MLTHSRAGSGCGNARAGAVRRNDAKRREVENERSDRVHGGESLGGGEGTDDAPLDGNGSLADHCPDLAAFLSSGVSVPATGCGESSSALSTQPPPSA